MDEMAKLMDAYRKGLLDEKELQKKLNKQTETWEANGQQQKIIQRLIVQTQAYTGNVEDIVCEKERKTELLTMFDEARKIVGDSDWKILSWYVIDKMTEQKIADRLKVSQQAVSSRLKRIQKKILKNFQKDVVKWAKIELIIEGENILKPPPIIRSNCKPLGWQMDFLREASVEGGTCQKNLKSNTCLLPEYINSVCTLCLDKWGMESKCKRKLVNKLV